MEGVPSAGGGQISVTTIPSTGWLSTDTASAYVLVVGGRAGALLTIYRPSDAVDMPMIEFRAVLKSTNMVAPIAALPIEPTRNSRLTELSILAHLQDVGDVQGRNDEWICRQDNSSPIEGFSLGDAGPIEPANIEYQGIMGRDWLTPWFKAGSFCGSRGLQLPMLGYRLRLLEKAAETHTLQYWGIFGDGQPVGPFESGELCQNDEMVLTAMKVSLATLATPSDPLRSRPKAETPIAPPPIKAGRRPSTPKPK